MQELASCWETHQLLCSDINDYLTQAKLFLESRLRLSNLSSINQALTSTNEIHQGSHDAAIAIDKIEEDFKKITLHTDERRQNEVEAKVIKMHADLKQVILNIYVFCKLY